MKLNKRVGLLYVSFLQFLLNKFPLREKKEALFQKQEGK
jgi:hypothetical protein